MQQRTVSRERVGGGRQRAVSPFQHRQKSLGHSQVHNLDIQAMGLQQHQAWQPATASAIAAIARR